MATATVSKRLMVPPQLPYMPGWYLVGRYLPDEVGSFILHHNGQAMLLEIPRGLEVDDVKGALDDIGNPELLYIAASHHHIDHFHKPAWIKIAKHFPEAMTIDPDTVTDDIRGTKILELGGEPLYLIKAPKHSWSDLVIVFRGVCCTGDIELGTIDSVNHDVPSMTRQRSMDYLRRFEEQHHYKVNTVLSAHLDDVRTDINFSSLFAVGR